MKPGKLSQTIVSRSILRMFHIQEDSPALVPSPFDPCAMLHAEGREILISTACRYGKKETVGVYAMAEAFGHLTVRGAKAKSMFISLFLPEWLDEEKLKVITGRMAKAAAVFKISLLGTKAEVLPGFEDILVQVQMQGRVEEKRLVNGEDFEQADLVFAGYAGLEGTLRILEEREEELKKRFVPAFLEPLKGQEEKLFLDHAKGCIWRDGVLLAHQAGDGGIFGALWDFTVGTGHGMLIDLKRIPLRQETIEICEYFYLNPYQLASAGCALFAAGDGEKLVRDLKACGLFAAVLGTLNDTNDKLIQNGEEIRCLDRPVPDEFVKIHTNKF